MVDPMGTYMQAMVKQIGESLANMTEEEREQYLAEYVNTTRDVGGVYVSEASGVAKFTGVDWLGKKITGKSISKGIKGVARKIAVSEGIKKEGVEIGEKAGVALTAGALIATPYASLNGIKGAKYLSLLQASKEAKIGVAISQLLPIVSDWKNDKFDIAGSLSKSAKAGLLTAITSNVIDLSGVFKVKPGIFNPKGSEFSVAKKYFSAFVGGSSGEYVSQLNDEKPIDKKAILSSGFWSGLLPTAAVDVAFGITSLTIPQGASEKTVNLLKDIITPVFSQFVTSKETQRDIQR
jgi:hypothetical protein